MKTLRWLTLGAVVLSAVAAFTQVSSNVTVFATGFNNPRGLKWGPDGNLYVAEAGTGGSSSTIGQCDQVVPPIGPYTGGSTARISRVTPDGTRLTFARGFPSARNAVGDVSGVGDVAFVGTQLYAVTAGGGCSHGHLNTPNAILQINADGSKDDYVNTALSICKQNNADRQTMLSNLGAQYQGSFQQFVIDTFCPYAGGS